MISVLDAWADEHAWLSWWEDSAREPQALPAYGRLLAGQGERAVALLLTKPSGSALVPLLLRPLPGRPGSWDAVSPYGYGGPFTRGSVAVEEVLTDLAAWAVEERICSVFLRLSLGLPAMPARWASGVVVVPLADNVIVNLRRSSEDVWTGYEHKVRKNVGKAVRAGCTVQRTVGCDDLDGFLEVYSETMQRRSAGAWYRFDRDWFESFIAGLGQQCSVFSARGPDGRLLSVELVLEGDRHLYSFLGGTKADAFSLSPNDLLKHEVVQHGQRTGREGYVLGGGFRPGDGIFRYKRSFDPDGVTPYRVVQIIGDAQVYRQLVMERSVDGAGPDPSFFPAYRAPSTAAI